MADKKKGNVAGLEKSWAEGLNAFSKKTNYYSLQDNKCMSRTPRIDIFIVALRQH